MPNANCAVNVGNLFIFNLTFCNIITMVVRLPVPRWEQLKIPYGNLYLFNYTSSVPIWSQDSLPKPSRKRNSVPSESYALYLHVTKNYRGWRRKEPSKYCKDF